MEKWRIKMVHLVYFGFILALVVFMSIGCGGGSSGGGGTGGGPGTANPVSINDDTPAGVQGVSIAFNNTGDAMAVWNSDNGSYFRKILYSVYTQATDTWSDEAELSTGNSNRDNVAVSSDGTDFMVVWANYNIYAREYTVSSGWGTEAIIDSGSPSAFSPHVASTGTGYCAVWSQRDSSFLRIYASVYNGSTWGTDTTVGSASGSAYSPKVASNGTGYCVTWPRNDSGTYNIYASIYTGAWTAEAALELIAGYADYPQIASDGSGYCVTWDQNDGALESIYANIYNGGWGGATLIESSGSYDAYSPKIASDGSGYGVVWRQNDGIVGNRVYGNEYDNTIAIPAWGGDGTIDSVSGGNCYDPDVAANGSGYGVTWRQYDSGSSTYNVLANIYDGVDWGTETLLESGSGEAIDPYIASDGTGYGVVWVQDDGSRDTVYANLSNGSGWGAESNLMQNQYYGSVTGGIRFAANNAGDVLAIWRQHDNSTNNLFGCLYSSGAWRSVFEITDNAGNYDISSDGDGFMIVHNHYSEIYAVPYDTTTGLGSEVQISSSNAYDCRIASNGTGYCATWRQWDSPNYDTYANLYIGGSWEAYATLTPLDSGAGAINYPQIASNGTGYCVTWNQDDGVGTEDVWARIYNGTIWGSVDLIESHPNEIWYPKIASNGTGYCVVWEQTDDIYANVSEGSPLVWTGPTLVELGSGWVDAPQVASNGSTYGVTWHQYDGSNISIYVNLYDGSWGTETTIESGSNDARYPRGASNGTGYCVSWVQDDGTSDSVYANTFDGSTWGTEQVLESSDTEVNNDWEMWPIVVAAQNTYTIGWLQEDANDSLVDNVWAYSGLSD